MDFIVLSIAIPAICALILLMGLWRCERCTRLVGLVGFGVPALSAGVVAYRLLNGTHPILGEHPSLVYSYTVGLDSFGIFLSTGVNGISGPLYLLAGIVGLAAGLQALSSQADRKGIYIALLLIMQAGLMGAFGSRDVFFSHVFHECALIPTFLMIGLWGGHGRRAVALELTIYLTAGAMLTLVGFVALYNLSGAQEFTFVALKEALQSVPLGDGAQSWLCAVLLVGLGILVSLWPFHAWAPRGYAAAPTAAAMLHAGVLKKFGLYVIIQLLAASLVDGMLANAHWLVWLALGGNVLYMGLVTMAQRDLKMMLGSSSVMHMGYAFLGIATMSVLGLGGAILLMFAHGLSIALSFHLAAAVYRRTDTYDMRAMGGLVKRAPVLAAFFAAAMLASIGLPGFGNFWGELSIFIALWQWSPIASALAILGIVIGAIYGLRAVASIFFGPMRSQFDRAADLTFAERVPALILLVALLWAGFWPAPMAEVIEQGITQRNPQVWPLLEPSDPRYLSDTQ